MRLTRENICNLRHGINFRSAAALFTGTSAAFVTFWFDSAVATEVTDFIVNGKINLPAAVIQLLLSKGTMQMAEEHLKFGADQFRRYYNTRMAIKNSLEKIAARRLSGE